MINKDILLGIVSLTGGVLYLLYQLKKERNESNDDMLFVEQVKIYGGVAVLIFIGFGLLVREFLKL